MNRQPICFGALANARDRGPSRFLVRTLLIRNDWYDLLSTPRDHHFLAALDDVE